MDVHPPLAKMMLALTGFVFGLNPSFDFGEIGRYMEDRKGHFQISVVHASGIY